MDMVDVQEKKILQELVKNPRISDNQISKKTGIPVKTVNRKRKRMEEENKIYYFTMVNNGMNGTKAFHGQQMYCVTLRGGLTRKQVTDTILANIHNSVLTKHIFLEFIGESNGSVVLIFWIMSREREDIIEIYNAEVVPYLEKLFGPNPIKLVHVVDINLPIRVFHNYIPNLNMERGIVKEAWDDSTFFIA